MLQYLFFFFFFLPRVIGNISLTHQGDIFSHWRSDHPKFLQNTSEITSSVHFWPWPTQLYSSISYRIMFCEFTFWNDQKQGYNVNTQDQEVVLISPGGHRDPYLSSKGHFFEGQEHLDNFYCKMNWGRFELKHSLVLLRLSSEGSSRTGVAKPTPGGVTFL